MNEHHQYMQRCLQLAGQAADAGESPVGCVIVKDGVIIGEAFEQSRQQKDITRHAEALAVINTVKAHGSCEGATLYTNVEPCALCSYVIRHYKIAHVIFNKHSGELGGTAAKFPVLTTETMSWGKAPVVTIYPGDEQE